MWSSVRSFDEHARDGVRRAIPLAIGMFLYQRSGSHDALWVFLAAYVVLLPTGKSSASVALARVASTVIGVALLGVLSQVVPGRALIVLGVAAVLLSLALSPPYPLLAGGLAAMGAVVLVGAPAGDIGSWAGHRLLDTLIGCALALASMYLLWPRDRAEEIATPTGGLSGAAALMRLAVGCLVFLVIVAWQVHRILKADLPGLKAIEGLAVAVPLFLYLFASIYLSLSHTSSSAFSEPLDHTGALYFAITVFATVGFGDITPRTDMARVLVSLQMLIDLVLLGALVRVIVGAAKVGLSRESRPSTDQS